MQHCPVLLPESDVKVSVQCKRHVTLLRKQISRDDRNASPKVLLMSNSVDSKGWSCIKCQLIYLFILMTPLLYLSSIAPVYLIKYLGFRPV